MTRGDLKVKASATVDEALLDLGQRLIQEHVDVPAGAVLRCLARSARLARAGGCPKHHLVATVEALTRRRLAQRTGRSAGGAGPQVLQVRSGSVVESSAGA
jgi:hypothetical protein